MLCIFDWWISQSGNRLSLLVHIPTYCRLSQLHLYGSTYCTVKIYVVVFCRLESNTSRDGGILGGPSCDSVKDNVLL